MPYPTQHVPAYRHHKSRGLGVVTLNGKDIYLGTYNSEQSLRKYDRLIQEWLASGRTATTETPIEGCQFSVAELIVAYLKLARVRYQKNGRPTSHLHNVEDALGYLKRPYGLDAVLSFGPLKLMAVQQGLIDRRLSRNTINKYIGCIKRMFKWGTSRELVPPSVFHGLQSVSGLQKGRSDAKENAPVGPVPAAHIDAIKPYLGRHIRAMIELQLVTGMRPGELVLLRSCDIDMTGKLWIYSPQHHKTEHHGLERPIYLGPKAQDLVRPFLPADSQEYIFNPREAVEEFHTERRKNRKSPMTPSQSRRRPKIEPKKTPADRYTTESYRRAIARACRRANTEAQKQNPELPKTTVKIPQWHPHQLRHNAATRLRKDYGLDAARVVLGHRSAAVTEIYAAIDHSRAQDIMEKVG